MDADAVWLENSISRSLGGGLPDQNALTFAFSQKRNGPPWLDAAVFWQGGRKENFLSRGPCHQIGRSVPLLAGGSGQRRFYSRMPEGDLRRGMDFPGWNWL